MSDSVINLYSDTQTKPTAGMLQAMVTAEVGDEQRFTDPTVLRLEAKVAELLGQEAAVFLPSGTMCNAIGVRLHVRPGGDEVILDEDYHPVDSEAGGPAAISGAAMRFLHSGTGIFSAKDLAAAIRPPSRYAPRSRLVIVEQTTNLGGGRVWPGGAIEEVLAVARTHGLRAHLDGARLFNASVAAKVEPAQFARGFDTAWIDFTKGLGAPIGAALAGSRELIEEAWRYKQMWGGAMRQTGIVAAACIYALDNHVQRLAEDHENSRLLAQGLAEIPGISIDPSTVETNIVVFSVADARHTGAALKSAGVDLLVIDDRRLRAVTYLGIKKNDVKEAIHRVARVVAAAG